MNNKALLDKLTAQLSILEHHIKRLKKNPDELHELDIELMGEKIKQIYSLVHELEAGNVSKKPEPTVVNEVEKVPLVEVKPEPEIPAPKAPEMNSEFRVLSSEPEDIVEEVLEEKQEEVPVVESKEEPIVKTPPTPEAIIEEPAASRQQPETINLPDPRSPEPINEQPEPPPVPDPRNPEPEADHKPKTTADLFSGPTTIADSFQADDDNSLAAKVNPTAVQDLKMAIGINDKFLFINELFKGDPSVYNQAIENLNTAGGAAAAEATIESFRGEYAWADNSEAYHRLKKIVKSKFNG